VAWAVSVLTAFSFLKATVGVFYGIPSHELRAEDIHEVAPSMRVGMGITGALCVVFGFAPQLLMQPVIEPAVHAMGFDWRLQVTWLGVLTGTGTIGVTVGAVAGLALAAAFGAGAYRLVRAPAGGRPVTVFSGGEPLPADDTLGVVDFAEMAEAAFGPIYSLNPDPLYLLIWREIRDGASGVRRFVATRIERTPVLAAAVCAAVLLVAVAVR
jgi:multicomponent Na+:H+ antiporter subunit A